MELGTGCINSRGKNLYEFWGDKITEQLNSELSGQKKPTIINLASNEYWSVVKPEKLQAEIITPIFKDSKNGQYKIISFFAKKARGLMSAFIIKNQIKNSNDLKAFDLEGYAFNKKMSVDNEWVFTREEI